MAGTPKAGSRASLPARGRRPGSPETASSSAPFGLPAANLHAAQRKQVLARLAGADCRRYARAAPESPSPPKDGGAASAPGSAVARPAFRPPAESAGSRSPGSALPGAAVGQIGALRLLRLLLFACARLGRRCRSGLGARRLRPPQKSAAATDRKAILGSPGIRHMAAETRLAR